MYVFIIMKRLLFLLLVPCISVNAQLLNENDKQKHFAAGAVIGGITYGLILEETEDKTAAFIASLAGAIAAGYIKESYDKKRGYGFDNRDLLSTAYGGLMIGVTLEIFARGKRKRPLLRLKQ